MSYCSGYHLSVVTEPAAEPISLDEALVQCHANAGVEDDWFYKTISVCRRDAEAFTRRAFIEQTLRITFDCWPGRFPILLPRPPLIEINSVSVYDTDSVETVIDPGNLLVDTFNSPGRVTFISGYSGPGVTLREINSFVIEYKAGYGATAANVPEDFQHAILLQLGYMYGIRNGEEPVPINDQWKYLLYRHKMWL